MTFNGLNIRFDPPFFAEVNIHLFNENQPITLSKHIQVLPALFSFDQLPPFDRKNKQSSTICFISGKIKYPGTNCTFLRQKKREQITRQNEEQFVSLQMERL